MSAFVLHVALLISIATRYKLLSSDDDVCRIQGTLMQFGAMGLVVWCVMCI